MKTKLAALLATSLAAACSTADLGPMEPDPVAAVAPATLPTTTPVAAPDAGAPRPADAAPQPDPRPPADAGPVFVPGLGMRYAPPEPSSCGHRDDTPMLPQAKMASAPADQLLDGESNSGLDPSTVLTDSDTLKLGATITIPPIIPPILVANLDSDGDCLPDIVEARLGTDPKNPDTDGDGWFDGPCNERRKLVLTKVVVHETQAWIGDDELYLVVDDVRHPQGSLDDYWSLGDGDEMTTAWLLASRTRGTAAAPLALVHVEGWEDDFEIIPDWSVDDLLFTTDIDLAAYANGDTFSRRFTGDYDYELTFRVDVEKFADPDPLHDGDSDGDGIKESAEARVSRDLGGLADPARKDVFVEVDWMRGHPLRANAKRMITTQYYRNGIQLNILRDEELPLDTCLTVPEARALYANHFRYKSTGAFRYAVLGEQIWNDRSGVAWGDMFLVDDSTWWINNWTLPQAGTFIHELGHTMSLTKDLFRLIDTIAWPSYDSAMNYLYQAIKVDYSSDGAGGDSDDFDDWAAVDPSYALKWSFGLTTSNEVGSCK